jgi:ribosomal protein L15
MKREVKVMRNLGQVMNGLSPERRKKIEARAAQLIAEELTVQKLRRARKLTHQRVSRILGIGKDDVSKLEKRADLVLANLRKSVEAMGGKLSLVAEFPDQPPVLLTGIGEADVG